MCGVLFCAKNTGYLYQIDIYTGKKEKREVGLGESVVLQMAESLENKGIELYFDNFFNSPILLEKLKEKGIRACGTIRKNRAHMPRFDADNKFCLMLQLVVVSPEYFLLDQRNLFQREQLCCPSTLL